MKTQVVIFPFDLFGGGAASEGAQLLADAIREMLADNAAEKIPTRARAYQDHVDIREFAFDKLSAYEDWRDKAGRTIRQAWRKSAMLLWVAGNHLGVLPVYDELSGDAGDTLVIQFDAHLDIYNLADCKSELSHGNFLLHCRGKMPTLVNLGHRELLLRRDYVGRFYAKTFAAAELAIDPEPAVAYLRQACGQAKRVFVDIDCDLFDPAFFPAVSHPLPFGVNPTTFLRLLEAVWSDKIIGVAISEFEPARDVADRSLAMLIWLVEYLLLKRYEEAS